MSLLFLLLSVTITSSLYWMSLRNTPQQIFPPPHCLGALYCLESAGPGSNLGDPDKLLETISSSKVDTCTFTDPNRTSDTSLGGSPHFKSAPTLSASPLKTSFTVCRNLEVLKLSVLLLFLIHN